MPDLKGADAWLDRAKEHLGDLKTLTDGVIEREVDTLVASVYFDPPLEPSKPAKNAVPTFNYNLPPSLIPPRGSVLAGETIQALRRSLDYLVFELAWLDSGILQDDTQFPIDDGQEAFRSRCQRKSPRDHGCYLVGVAPKHAAVIERFQPYKGMDWTRRLADLSNPDKHRHLTTGVHRTSSSITRVGADDGTDRHIERLKNGIVATWHPSEDMHMKVEVTVYVAFEDRKRIIETLDKLKTEVAYVLDEFRPCFDGKCAH